MTMIAMTLNRGVPIIIGDILISGNEKPPDFILPSRAEDILSYLSSDAEMHPVFLNRKIYIPKQNVCIAFAGNLSVIKSFIQDLTIFCNALDKVTATSMQNFLTGYGLTRGHGISFLMLVAEEVNGMFETMTVTHGDWDKIISPLFGSVLSTGSGSDNFIEEVMEAAEFFSALPLEGVEIAAQANVILLCKLLSLERIGLKNVKRFWGAGFEMIYLVRGGFKHFDNITYVINHARFDGNGDIEIPIPEIIMHYRYIGEKLIITAIHPLKGETEIDGDAIIIRYKEFTERPFIAEPIYCSGISDDGNSLIDPSFSSERVAMGYVIETRTGDFLPASFNAGPELVVKYEYPDLLVITMHKELNDRLAREAKKVFINRKF